MLFIYQDLDWVISKTRRLYEKNPRHKVSTLFRFFRNHPNLSCIGDYPILSAITTTMAEMGIASNRHSINRALNKSEELRKLKIGRKTSLLNQLINPLTGDMGKAKFARRRPGYLKRYKRTSQAQEIKN